MIETFGRICGWKNRLEAEKKCRILVVWLYPNSEKIDDVAVNNGMPNDQMVSKPKIRGCPDLQFGVGELWVAQLLTPSFSPKF